jgi:hypothetical protein
MDECNCGRCMGTPPNEDDDEPEESRPPAPLEFGQWVRHKITGNIGLVSVCDGEELEVIYENGSDHWDTKHVPYGLTLIERILPPDVQELVEAAHKYMQWCDHYDCGVEYEKPCLCGKHDLELAIDKLRKGGDAD